MKKVLGLSATLLAGVVIGIFLIGIPVTAQRGAGGMLANQNGDTNGDGVLDIADAVYLLLHLFKGGSPPVTFAESPEFVSRVEELERKVQDLFNNDSALQQGLDEVRTLSSNLVFLFSGNISVECMNIPGQRCEPLLKVGRQFGLKNGEVGEKEFLFQTNRISNLVFGLHAASVSHPATGAYEFLLDGQKIDGFPSGVYPVSGGYNVGYAFDVPAGQHSFAIYTGSFQNSLNLGSLIIQYLD